jgi:hypothetical protein
MRQVKNAGVFILLLAGHFVLGPVFMIILYCIIGGVLALMPGPGRFPLLIVPLSEMVIGLAFRLFYWDGRSLRSLSANFGMGEWLTVAAIAVNVITAFLLAFTSYYLVRWIAGSRTVKKPTYE